MPTARKIHRILTIEELEPRVAPATLVNGGVFSFEDASGDLVQVRFTGPGSVTFRDAGGNDPDQTDIATMIFDGATKSTKLFVTDANPGTGGDSLVLGNVTAINGATVGNVTIAGTLSGSNMAVPYIQKLSANAVNGSTISPLQGAGTVTVNGNLANSMLLIPNTGVGVATLNVSRAVSGSTLSLPYAGKITAGSLDSASLISAGTGLGAVKVNGTMSGSTLAAPHFGSFSAGALDGASVLAGVTAGSINVGGTITGSTLSSPYLSKITSKSVGASLFFADTSIGNIKITGDLTDSVITVPSTGYGIGTLKVTGKITDSQITTPSIGSLSAKSIDPTIITVGVTAGAISASGGITGSTLSMARAGVLKLGNMDSSLISAGASVGNLAVTGAITNGSRLFIPSLGSLSADTISGLQTTLGEATGKISAKNGVVDGEFTVLRNLAGVPSSGNIQSFSFKGDVVNTRISLEGRLGDGLIKGDFYDDSHIAAPEGLGSLKITGSLGQNSSIVYQGVGNLSLNGTLSGLIQSTRGATGGISLGAIDESGVLRLAGDIDLGSFIRVRGGMNGMLSATGDVLGKLVISGAVGTNGYISVGDVVGPDARIIIKGDFNGMLVADGIAPGTIQISGTTAGRNIFSRTTPILLNPSPAPIDMVNPASFAYTFRGFSPSLWLSGDPGTSVEVFLLNPVEGVWSLRAYDPLTGLTSSDVTFREMVSSSTIDTMNILAMARGAGIEGTLELAGFAGDDIMRIGGSLNNLTVQSGDLAGLISVAHDILGTVTLGSPVGSLTGSITARDLQGSINAPNIAGPLAFRNVSGSILSLTDMTSTIRISGNLTGLVKADRNLGSVFVTGNVTDTGVITAGAAIAGMVTVGQGLFGRVLANTDILDDIRVMGASGVAAGALIQANGSVRDDVRIAGNLSGALWTGNDLSGRVIIGGGVTTSGAILIGRDVAGSGMVTTGASLLGGFSVGRDVLGRLLAGADLQSDVVVANRLAGQILVGGNMAGLLFIGPGGVSQGAAIGAGGTISSNIGVAGNFAGMLQAGTDISGDLYIAGNLSSSGQVLAGRNLSGMMTMEGNLVGAISAGAALSGNLAVLGAVQGQVRTGADINGNVSVGTGGIAQGGRILAGGAIFGDMLVAGNVAGTLGAGLDLGAGIQIAGQVASTGLLDIGRNVASSGHIEVAGDVAANAVWDLTSLNPLATTATPLTVASGDFNRDGRPDLAVGLTTGQVVIYVGNGNGKFTQLAGYTAGTNPAQITVFDYNLDSNPDLAVANTGSNYISVFRGNGNGTFASALTYGVGTGFTPNFIAAGDVNNDTRPDLVVASVGTAGTGRVSTFLGNTAGTFSTAGTGTYSLSGNATSIALGLFDAGSNLDFAVTNQVGTAGTGTVAIYLGNGNGTFNAWDTIAVGTFPRRIVAADIDGGALDLLVINSAGTAGNSMVFLRGNGDGSFRAPIPATTFATDTGPVSLAVLDLNGDGRKDVVTANSAGETISVLLATTSGSPVFAAARNYPAGPTPMGLAAGDFTSDGLTDFVTANRDVGTLTLLAGDGSGGFPIVGNAPQATAVGDFNEDGWQDIVFASSSGNYVSLLLGRTDESATFRNAVTFGIGAGSTNPRGLVVADLNNDGRLDIAVANFGSANISVLLGNGNGTFRSAVTYGAGAGASAIAVGDFNNDSIPDLATANATANTVSILLGLDNGVFGPPANIAAGTTPMSLVVGDLDNDGRPDDVATANFGSNNVSVLLGNGNGTFLASTYGVGAGPRSIALGLINGDANLDLTVANETAGTVSVLLGNGNGSFGAAATAATLTNPRSVKLQDLNGDGMPDLIVTNDIASLSIFMGLGNGSFQPLGVYSGGRSRTTYAVGRTPLSAVVGDFNKDGALDIVTGNAGSNSISTLLGRSLIIAPSIRIGGNISTSSLLAPNAIGIGGSLLGRIDIAGRHDGSASIDIAGSMKGDLLAALLGDVFIGADFRGLINAGTAGSANTLTLMAGFKQTGSINPTGSFSAPYAVGSYTINSAFKTLTVIP